MTRLHVVCEGQSEVNFVKKLLVPHLLPGLLILPRAVLTSKTQRGGMSSYQKAKNEIQINLRELKGQGFCTTMFDLYRLPHDFPGYAQAAKIRDPHQRATHLEKALTADINDPRFFPHLQVHELEALIFAAPQQLNWEYLDNDPGITELVAVADSYGNPELINGGEDTAPSKRILKSIPGFDKATAGIAVLEKIGLDTLRNRCPHFAAWLTQIEITAIQ